ncbi:hypothetical protein RR46_07371 [Papilio xuthus]|uniref:Uncharacterized protein n=1 Tax=Papilio xuthus TaxID=66420 RepID=A0A194PXZ6_PAPXU|nr:hypothetical protein RR46_07371 [Papilio xuthus]
MIFRSAARPPRPAPRTPRPAPRTPRALLAHFGVAYIIAATHELSPRSTSAQQEEPPTQRAASGDTAPSADFDTSVQQVVVVARDVRAVASVDV